MKVYRVQFKDGIGPYARSNRTHLVGDFVDELHTAHGWMGDIEAHPAGHDDIPNFYELDSTVLFGFKSLAQLYQWFDSFLHRIVAAGGEICEFDVDDEYVVEGKSNLQVVFNPEAAQLICKHSYDGTFAIGS